jgi:hypothetical protein
MIASWMLYTVVLGALFTLTAAGLERVASTLRRPVMVHRAAIENIPTGHMDK